MSGTLTLSDVAGLLASVDAQLARLRAERAASPLGRARRYPLISYRQDVDAARCTLQDHDTIATTRQLTGALRSAVSGLPDRVAEHLADLPIDDVTALGSAAGLLADVAGRLVDGSLHDSYPTTRERTTTP